MGMPGWAMALAAPFGLQKFVVEPAGNVYNMAQGIRNDINAKEDDQASLGFNRKLSKVRSLDELDAMAPDLQSVQVNNAGTYNNLLKNYEAKKNELIGLRDQADSTEFFTAVLTSKDPQKTIADFGAQGKIHPKYLQDIDKAVQETRSVIKDTFERNEKEAKKASEKEYYGKVAEFASGLTPNDNTPFNEVLGKLYQFAKDTGVDPEKAVKDVADYYKNQRSDTKTRTVNRVTYNYQTNKFGEEDKSAQSTQSVININANTAGTVRNNDLYKTMMKTREAYDKAVQGQMVTLTDAEGNVIQTTTKKFSRAELDNLRNTANVARRNFQAQNPNWKTTHPGTSKKKASKERTWEPSPEVAQQYVDKYGSVEKAQAAWKRGD